MAGMDFHPIIGVHHSQWTEVHAVEKKTENKILGQFKQRIENSQSWQAYNTGRVNTYVGQGPDSIYHKKIDIFLDGRVPRDGLKNKFSNLLYRVSQWFSEKISGKSDYLTARDHIVSILIQANDVDNKNRNQWFQRAPTPIEVKVAETLLAQMVEEVKTQLKNK